MSVLTTLASQKFVHIAAGGDPKASQGQQDLFATLTAEGANIGTAVWDATWNEGQMAEAVVAALVAEQRDINFATFAEGTVLPEGASAAAGRERMYSFDPAYRIEGARDWLFAQSK